MPDPLEVACPACGRANRPDVGFCTACGGHLARACSDCGHEAASEDRFCARCGKALGPAPPGPARRFDPPRPLVERIAHAREELEGERKPVTALVVDLVGSMGLARRFDAEEWRLILERYFRRLAEGVYRFEGVVNQFTGDGALALFGVPVAHEDHAERACRSACWIRERVQALARELQHEYGIDFAVRMGLSSGEVVVGRIGDDLHTEYTAAGYVVGLAARMQSLAGPGEIYATRATASLAAGFVELRDLGRFPVKGLPEPIHVFALGEVSGARSRFDVSRGRGLSRLVGREDELAQLETALAEAAAGRGQLVDVVGEPGVGKSRLCLEFADRARLSGLRVHAGHCVSHGRTIPFLPMLELLRAWFAFEEGASADDARARILATMTGLDPPQRAFLPVLFDFLRIADPEQPPPSMDPEARHRQIAALLGDALRLAGARAPLVLVVEDLQWIDPASGELLAAIATAVARTRVLLVVNHRPEYEEPWRGADHVRRIDLAPLGSEASDALLRQLLGAGLDLAPLVPRILERSGGNPFFIEEAVRSLAEEGVLAGEPGAYRLTRSVEQIRIPESLHSIIAARIDRLDRRTREVVHTAAVLGKSFPAALLAAVSGVGDDALGAALDAAVAAGLVREQRGHPEPEYTFHHPLTHEVAYRSLLARRRARLHAAAANAIRERSPERVDENAALLAYHFEQAGDTFDAARCHARAAEWRSVDHAPASMHHWRRVRELVRELPDSDEVARLGLTAHVRLLNLGWRLGVSEEEGDSLYEEGTRLASRYRDLRAQAMIANLYVAIVQAGLGRSLSQASERSRERVREASRLAAATEDPGLRLAVRVNRLYARFLGGDLRGALALAEETLERPPEDRRLGSEMFRFSPIIWIQSFQGQLLSLMGRPLEAAEPLAQALRWAREQGEMENLGWAEDFCVTQAWALGNGKSALAHARCAVEIADTTGSAFSRILAYKALGLALGVDARWAEAVAALETALGISRAQRANVYEEASVLAHLAEAHLHAGDAKVAAELAQEALAAARQRDARLYECEAEIARAGALLALGERSALPEVAAALDAAAAGIERTGATSYAPFVLERRATLARLDGDERRRREALDAARRLYEAMGSAMRAQHVARELEPGETP